MKECLTAIGTISTAIHVTATVFIVLWTFKIKCECVNKLSNKDVRWQREFVRWSYPVISLVVLAHRIATFFCKQLPAAVVLPIGILSIVTHSIAIVLVQNLGECKCLDTGETPFLRSIATVWPIFNLALAALSVLMVIIAAILAAS